MVQAARAICIDFGNLPFEQPSLLGLASEGEWAIAMGLVPSHGWRTGNES